MAGSLGGARLVCFKSKRKFLGVSRWISHTSPHCWAVLRCSSMVCRSWSGLEKLAGVQDAGVLRADLPTISVIFGTLITGVIQSSAGTVVICVGLVNSGIMTLTQSVGVIMGANIGTTVTGQLIRMADISGDSLLLTLIQPKTFAPVVAFVGCIFYVFLRNAKKKNIGQIMLGFGILFTGMSLMDLACPPCGRAQPFRSCSSA